MFKPADLFDLSQTAHAAIFDGCEYAWDALKKIEAYLEANLRPGLHNRCEGVAFVGERVFIGEGTVVEDGAMIKGPAIIGRNCQIRHNAYIREHVIIGDNCVVGNSCEVKNSLLFNEAVAPHFNYVGDSILGYQSHLGAGREDLQRQARPRECHGGRERRSRSTPACASSARWSATTPTSAAMPCSTPAASSAAARSSIPTSTGAAFSRPT